MRRPSRLPALAALFLVTAGVNVASAQTLIVRNGVAASPVELFINGSRTLTMSVGPDGSVAIPLGISSALNKSQADVKISIDACGAMRRILIDENGRPAPDPEAGCVRKAIPDIFVLQGITTMVLDIGGETPLAFIRQGPAPPEWLGGEAAATKRVWTPAPKGLVVSVGSGIGRYTQLLGKICGDAPVCADDARPFVRSASLTYWFSKLVAAEVGYMKPPKMHVAGSGTTGATYRFTSGLDASMLTIMGRAGGQAGPVKLTGFVGLDYQASTFTNTQTVDATTIARGGTQSSGFKAQGWGYVAGGGLESWLNKWVAIYGEGGIIAIKGSNPTNKGEGSVDDQISFAVGGLRVHLGR